MNGPVFERFADESPMSVMTAVLIARVFTAEKLNALFEEVADEQYTQDLFFSTVFDLMQRVVCAIEPSVHAAYQTSEDEIEVSVTSVYNKLGAIEPGVEPGVSAELVRYSGEALGSIVRALGGERPAWLEGYSTKVLDGHCLDGHCLDGHCLDGHCLDGHCLDGHCLDGHCLDGHCLDGLDCLDGLTALTALGLP